MTERTQQVVIELPVAVMVNGEAVVVGHAQVPVEVYADYRYSVDDQFAFLELVNQVSTNG